MGIAIQVEENRQRFWADMPNESHLMIFAKYVNPFNSMSKMP
jgi:hypothetical protein